LHIRVSENFPTVMAALISSIIIFSFLTTLYTMIFRNAYYNDIADIR